MLFYRKINSDVKVIFSLAEFSERDSDKRGVPESSPRDSGEETEFQDVDSYVPDS